MKIDLNLFRVFDVIYCEGSISKAANVLNLSQPAVSHSLAKLRGHFDDPLFVRQGNIMRPTPVAKNVIADVRKALHQLQVSLLQSRQFDPLIAHKNYAIALHSSFEVSFLPKLFTQLSNESPHISLSSYQIRRSEMEMSLASGDLDLAIDVLLPVSENILHSQLEQNELVVVASKQHSTITNTLDLASYLQQDHVLVSSRRTGPGIEDFELGRIGLQRRVALRCQHLFSACRMVEKSDVLLTLPKTAATMFSEILDVVLYPLPVELPQIDLHLYWHLSVDKDPANKWLRNKINLAAIDN